MTWRFVKQPDGRLALFSDAVDAFLGHGFDEAGALSASRGRGLSAEEAAGKVRAGFEDHLPWTGGRPGSGHDRWDHALEAVARTHGMGALRGTLAAIGFADAGIPPSATDAAEEHASVAEGAADDEDGVRDEP